MTLVEMDGYFWYVWAVDRTRDDAYTVRDEDQADSMPPWLLSALARDGWPAPYKLVAVTK